VQQPNCLGRKSIGGTKHEELIGVDIDWEENQDEKRIERKT